MSIVKVEAPQVNVSFTGPVTADPRQIRDVCTQVFHEALPIELAGGIRGAEGAGGYPAPGQTRAVRTQVSHEALPTELAAGTREAKMPVVY